MKPSIVTAEMELGGQEVIVQGYVHFHREADYGSDADGNRGVSRVFVNDVTDITAYTDIMDELSLSQEDKDRAAEKLTRTFLEE